MAELIRRKLWEQEPASAGKGAHRRVQRGHMPWPRGLSRDTQVAQRGGSSCAAWPGCEKAGLCVLGANYTTIKNQEITAGISSTYFCEHGRESRAVKEQHSCYEYAVNQFKPQKAGSRCTSPFKFMMEIAAFCKSLLFLQVAGHHSRKPSCKRLPTMFDILLWNLFQ